MDSEIKVWDKTFVPFIPQAELEASIEKLAQRINADFAGRDVIPIVVCVLNGAMLFTAELVKYLDFDFEMAAVKAKSYVGTSSSGVVRVSQIMGSSIVGREVILCEDIVDTGNTINKLAAMLEEEGASKVHICTMLFKPEVYAGKDPVEYIGMSIPNKFILGYGLDYNELGRGYKDIYVLADN